MFLNILNMGWERTSFFHYKTHATCFNKQLTAYKNTSKEKHSYPANFSKSQLLPRWCSGKESTRQCRRIGRHRFDLWVRKIPWSRKWQPAPVFLPGKFHGQRSLGRLQSMGLQRVGHNWVYTHSLKVTGYFFKNAHNISDFFILLLSKSSY